MLLPVPEASSVGNCSRWGPVVPSTEEESCKSSRHWTVQIDVQDFEILGALLEKFVQFFVARTRVHIRRLVFNWFAAQNQIAGGSRDWDREV